MSNNSFKVKNGLTLTPIDTTTILSPQAGDLVCDINDNNKIKRYAADSSTWQEVGTSSIDSDMLFVQNFDSAALTNFTHTGLELNTTDSMHGNASAKLTHDSVANQSFSEPITVNPKFRGINITASLLVKSTASDGNLTFTAYDLTNSATLTTQNIQTDSQAIASLVTTNSSPTVSGFTNDIINTLKVGMSVTGTGIAAGTEISAISTTALTITLSANATASGTVTLRFSELPKTVQLGFSIPANCSSVSYTITGLPESGSPETYIDDIVFRNYFLGMSNQGQSEYGFEVPVSTDWESFIPTGSMTTNTTYTGFKRRNKDRLELQYKMAFAGVPNTTAITLDLPTWEGLPIAIDTAKLISTDNTSSLQSMILGTGSFADASGGGPWELAARYNTTTTVAVKSVRITTSIVETSAAASQATPVTVASGDFLVMVISVPIAGWDSTEIKTVVVNDLVPAKAVLGNTALTIPTIGEWAAYTPTFTGYGTAASPSFYWRQNGSSIDIEGRFTAGTTTGVEARISLPNSYTSSSQIQTIQTAGIIGRGGSTANFYGYYALIEPSVTYMTLGSQTSAQNALAKQLGTAITTGEVVTINASIPIAGLSATEEVVVSGTQAALVQQADSSLRVDANTLASGTGSTATGVRRFSTVRENIGSDVVFTDDSTNASRFTIVNSGIYSISFSDSASVTSYVAITKNSTQLTVQPFAVDEANLLSVSYMTTATGQASTSWTGYLVAGDVIRAQVTASTTTVAGQICCFSIAKQGSLQVATVNADQKIIIPTSELRFEGASSRGAVATAIVKFDTQAKIRGDAFTVTNTANDGTYITITKAGKLEISSSLALAATNSQYISKNQASLTTALPAVSEILATSGNGTGANSVDTCTWSGFVNIGDILRVSATVAPISVNANNMSLAFQEQNIQVSVSNTLPQFSESDSSVRIDTANGYGSTATKIRRFSNIRENIGTDIVYVDDATNGASFRVLTSGIYSITYTDLFTGAGSYLGITKNETQNTTNIDSMIGTDVLAVTRSSAADLPETVPWQGFLTQGDVIRAHTNGIAVGANGTIVTKFTMSKIGKPNVTGVDVTPFINIPQPIKDSITWTGSSASLTNAVGEIEFSLSALITSSANVIVATDDSANTRTKFIAIENCIVDVSFSALQTTQDHAAYIYKNGVIVMKGTETYTANRTNLVSTSLYLSAGEYISVGSAGTLGAGTNYFTLTAVANSPQILTVPETFSTDNANLAYAGSAAYTLPTLPNAPIGTFITYIYTGSTNTRTQTTTAPTQTIADMNANGIKVFTRAYATLSTAASPVVVAIQIGKGLKGVSLTPFQTTGKTLAGNLDSIVKSTTAEYGFHSKDYNETTGVLLLDGGFCLNTTTTNREVQFIDTTTASAAYVVINASKNPALTGININKVAVRAVGNTGSVITANVTDLTFTEVEDNTNSWNGTAFTVPETGTYDISIYAYFVGAAARGITMFIGGVSSGKDISDYLNNNVHHGSYTGDFSKGQVVTFRTSGSGTQSNVSAHYLNITKLN
jgi:hypothetical protein